MSHRKGADKKCDETLHIPGGQDIRIKVGQCLCIQVDKTCTWCYDDPTPCFPDGLLPPGTYTATHPPTVYGPYCAENAGTVTYDAVTSGPCTPRSDTPHSIVVS